MRKNRSALRCASIAVLLIGLTCFVRGSQAQDLFGRRARAQELKVAPEPLERDIEGGDADDRAQSPVFAQKKKNEAQAEDANGAVAREPLERVLGRNGGDAAAAEGDAQAVQGVVEMLLGAFNGPAPADDGNIPANLRPFMPALNDALTIEIHYLRKCCNPDEQQLKALRAAGEKKIVEIAQIVARNQHQAFNNEVLGGRGPLLEGLLAEAKKVLPAEKYDSYRKEVEARQAARLRGACEMMTLTVDHTLSFPPDVYDKVVQLLTENSQPQWTHTMQTFFYQDYCPLPGVELLKPVLNDRQQKIWSGKERRTSSISFGWPANIGLQQWGLNVKLKELDDYSREAADE